MNFFDMYENVKSTEKSVVTTQKTNPEVETKNEPEVETETENENELENESEE